MDTSSVITEDELRSLILAELEDLSPENVQDMLTHPVKLEQWINGWYH